MPTCDFQKTSGNSKTLRASIYGPQGRRQDARQQVGPGTARSERRPSQRNSNVLLPHSTKSRMHRAWQTLPATTKRWKTECM